MGWRSNPRSREILSLHRNTSRTSDHQGLFQGPNPTSKNGCPHSYPLISHFIICWVKNNLNRKSKSQTSWLWMGGGNRTQHKILGPTDHPGATYPVHMHNVPDLTASSCSLLWHQKTVTEESAVCGYGHGHFSFQSAWKWNWQISTWKICRSSLQVLCGDASTVNKGVKKMDKCCIFPKVVLCAWTSESRSYWRIKQRHPLQTNCLFGCFHFLNVKNFSLCTWRWKSDAAVMQTGNQCIQFFMMRLLFSGAVNVQTSFFSNPRSL